ERAIPERVEAFDLLLLGEDVRLPMSAQVRVMVRVATGPAKQALHRRARVEERRDRRLREAEVRGDGLGVAPRLEKVVIGAENLYVRAGLVAPLAERYRQRHALHPTQETL